jgi:hypothetical protein
LQEAEKAQKGAEFFLKTNENFNPYHEQYLKLLEEKFPNNIPLREKKYKQFKDRADYAHGSFLVAEQYKLEGPNNTYQKAKAEELDQKAKDEENKVKKMIQDLKKSEIDYSSPQPPSNFSSNDITPNIKISSNSSNKTTQTNKDPKNKILLRLGSSVKPIKKIGSNFNTSLNNRSKANNSSKLQTIVKKYHIGDINYYSGDINYYSGDIYYEESSNKKSGISTPARKTNYTNQSFQTKKSQSTKINNNSDNLKNSNLYKKVEKRDIINCNSQNYYNSSAKNNSDDKTPHNDYNNISISSAQNPIEKDLLSNDVNNNQQSKKSNIFALDSKNQSNRLQDSKTTLEDKEKNINFYNADSKNKSDNPINYQNLINYYLKKPNNDNWEKLYIDLSIIKFYDDIKPITQKGNKTLTLRQNLASTQEECNSFKEELNKKDKHSQQKEILELSKKIKEKDCSIKAINKLQELLNNNENQEALQQEINKLKNNDAIKKLQQEIN